MSYGWAVHHSGNCDDLDVTDDAKDVLETARQKVLEDGQGLAEHEILTCLQIADDRLPDLLRLAHQVRRTWCGDTVEIEGIVSVKTGGCPGGLSLLLAVADIQLAGAGGQPRHRRAGGSRAADSRDRGE